MCISRNDEMKMRKYLMAAVLMLGSLAGVAQTKIYDETIDPDLQLSEAVAKAKGEGKFVVAQLGGNWCRWCIMFAKFVESDDEIKALVNDNFEFIHVNYNPRTGAASDAEAEARALRRLGNPVRFGYPVLVVLDGEGNVVHTQDSALLESGEGYDREKVIRFFRSWTPSAVSEAIAPGR